MTSDHLSARIDRLESIEAIRQLAARYALAIDSRDIDAWLSLFVDDVDCGSRGTGREALRTFIEPALRCFYRSVHLVGGHCIEFEDANRATGTVYCRAEHEVGDEWVVMAIAYFDTYERRDGAWFFARRHEQHWYCAEQLERPGQPFRSWAGFADRPARLPEFFASWHGFWESVPAARLAEITRAPV